MDLALDSLCGGWACFNATALPRELVERDGNLSFCDIPVIGPENEDSFDDPSWERRPFIMRGLAHMLKLQQQLSKENLVEAGRERGLEAHYGYSWDIVMNKGEGPRVIPLDTYIDKKMHSEWYDGDERLERAYSFDRHTKILSLPGVSIEVPPLIRMWNESAYTPSTAKPLFLIGGALSGIGFHRHASSMQLAVHGRKRWVFYPPEANPPGGTHGGWAILDWFRSIYPSLEGKRAPIECISKPGDLIYIPEGWYHAVVNLADSVAVTLQRDDLSTKFLALEFDAKQIVDERPDLAASLLKKLLRLQPKNLDARLQLFRALKKASPEKAWKVALETIERDPYFQDMQYDLANFLSDLHTKFGHGTAITALRDGLKQWKPYLENNTRSLQANHMLSQFYLLHGEREHGLRHLRRNVELAEMGISDARISVDFKSFVAQVERR